jgi:hypothetical protein
MTTFIIDPENSITALTNQEVAGGIPDGVQLFTSDRELLKLAADWPAERLIEIWNSISGVKAVMRFTSRKAGVARQEAFAIATDPEQTLDIDSEFMAAECRSGAMIGGKIQGTMREQSMCCAYRRGDSCGDDTFYERRQRCAAGVEVAHGAQARDHRLLLQVLAIGCRDGCHCDGGSGSYSRGTTGQGICPREKLVIHSVAPRAWSVWCSISSANGSPFLTSIARTSPSPMSAIA